MESAPGRQSRAAEHPVTAGTAPKAERRHLCVLFCDLAESTQLAHRLDAEELQGVYETYRRTCKAVVLRHDGFVAKYIGDGINLYFGYPCAHEDDALRAVRCAFDMLEAVRPLDLQVRIGIDSSRVVVGMEKAVGETLNIATLGLYSSVSVEERLDCIDTRLAELGITDSDAAPLFAELLSVPTGERYLPLVISPIRRRARTMNVLISALKATASRQRTTFVVEDLHWADRSTLELLQLIVASAPRLPLLGIFTARPEVQSVWTGAGVASLIELSRLSNDEVVAVASGIARGKLIPAEVMRSLTRTASHPGEKILAN
jgi:hypothetical protein